MYYITFVSDNAKYFTAKFYRLKLNRRERQKMPSGQTKI